MMQIAFIEGSHLIMKGFRFSITFVVAGLLLLPAAVEGQTAHLVLQGDPGEGITQGQSYDLTYTPENSDSIFSANVTMLAGGLPSRVTFQFGLFSPPYTTLDFGTNQLGIPLLPGTYSNAERASFATPGHPGLDVTFNNRGYDSLTGDFTINSAVFAPDPNASAGFRIVYFDATFNERGGGRTAALHGSFTYSAIPEPSSFALLSLVGITLIVRAVTAGTRKT